MHRWFHPNLTNIEAEKLLLERGVDGSFLVRPSKSCAGQFSLSVRRRDKVTHIKIRHLGDFYDLHGGESFATLAELIQYYTENQLREKNGEVFELKRPLNSSDPTTKRWFHGSISGVVAEKLIRDKGVNGSFLVRESQSKIGDYVLTVRTKDELSQADKVSHVMIRHHNNKYDVGDGGEKFDTLTELVEYYRRNPMVETTGAVVNMKYPFNATSITASDIDARVLELSKENPQNNGREGFWEEFEHLQHQECKVLFNRKVGQEDGNMLKNRYKNILPYDYTRVILKRPTSMQALGKPAANIRNSLASTLKISTTHQKGGDDSDYINANYIKLVNDDGATISPRTKPVPFSKVYIATQGPLPNTVADFWLMVWQEKSDCIVMVTEEVERRKNKCFRYWPSEKERPLEAGPFEIVLLNEQKNQILDDEYSFREFILRFRTDLGKTNELYNSGNNNYNDLNNSSNINNGRPTSVTALGPVTTSVPSRRVVQYQYHSWPDQHTPSNPASILSFLAEINRHPPRGPMIVHCSAGIGRSGTLMVIDMLVDQLKHHGLTYEVDIQRIVKIARAQRSGLVQTEAQYKFIYIAIRDFVASMKHLSPSEIKAN